jgi:hypothetical protein
MILGLLFQSWATYLQICLEPVNFWSRNLEQKIGNFDQMVCCGILLLQFCVWSHLETEGQKVGSFDKPC